MCVSDSCVTLILLLFVVAESFYAYDHRAVIVSCFLWSYHGYVLSNSLNVQETLIQFTTVEFSTVQLSSFKFSSVLFSSVQFCSVLFCSVLFCSLLFSSVQF